MRRNDTDIVKDVLAGDTDAFAALVERYGDMVYNLVRRTLGDGEEARDVTQDIFIKVYGALGKWKGGSSFSTWLYRVAYNVAISHGRKHRRNTEYVSENRLAVVGDDDIDALFRKAAEEKRYGDLERALGKLAAAERALVMLFYTDGRSIAELAEITGNSAANVKVKLHRVRKKLFILMSDGKE